ncbi:MAG: F0F1 ATP synthase subunit B [bacterium]|nr:F0F1 ATP synthase subunit B [bacterium]
MEILNLQQIIWQAVNFLILYLIIAKFVVPPTQKYLNKRDQEIREGLSNADKVKQQLAEAENLKGEILASARADGQKLLEEMRVRADELSLKLHEEAKTAAQVEAEKIKSQAEADAEKRRQDLNDEAVHLAGLIAKKSLAGALDINLQHDLLQKQLQELKNAKVHSH